MAACAPCVLLALGAIAARPAHAQSCCSLVSEDEISVVPRHRRALLTTRLAAKSMLFLHDRDGHSHPLGADVSATDLVLAVGGGLRLPFYDRLQLNGMLPVRTQLRTLPSAEGPDSATAVGAGDAALFLRWSALDDEELGLCDPEASARPSLDLFAGTKLPTGRYADGPEARDLARTTGDGSAALIAGVTVLKYVGSNHGARLSLRYVHHLPRDSDTALTGYDSFTEGDQLGVTAGYWISHGMHWLFGATLDTTWTFASSASRPGARGEALADTEMRQTSLGVQVTRVLHMPNLDFTLALGSDLPLPAVSANVSWEGLQASVALRYHFLDPG